MIDDLNDYFAQFHDPQKIIEDLLWSLFSRKQLFSAISQPIDGSEIPIDRFCLA